MKAQEEEKGKAQAMAIAAWADKHRVVECNLMNAFGKCVVPTSWLELAGDMAARELKPKNTAVVDASIRTMGKNDNMTNVEVLIFSNDLKKANLNAKKLIFDINKPKPEPVHFYSIIGGHTVTSIGKSHKTRPNNPDYQFVHCSLICCEDTPYNRQMAKAYGALENKIKDNRSKTDTWDLLWSMHSSYIQCLANYQKGDEKAFKKEWRAEKARLLAACNVGSKGAFDQNITIAQKTGPVWDNICKIFKGEVEVLAATKKPPKAPTGVGHFKFMGTIPDEKLNTWLERVVQGQETIKEFGVNCQKYKQKIGVKQAIVDYVKVIRDKEQLTWDDMVEEWPSLGETVWFELVMGWVGSVNVTELTNSIKEEILVRLLLDEDDEHSDEETASQVFII